MGVKQAVLCVVIVLLGGCESSAPPLSFRGSAPCFPGSGTVETWCNDANDCEFRTNGGASERCNAADTTCTSRAAADALAACMENRPPGPVTGEADAGTAADAAVRGEVTTDELDLLLVVDNSNSMSEEQIALTRELPRLVRVLSSGDIDGDGAPDFPAVRSLHVGVVTSDMGVGGFTTATCGNGVRGFAFGDDGILRSQGRTAIPGCMASYPSVFEFIRGTTNPDEFATAVACVATVGTGGCGFEQQLDASLKAVSPATAQVWTRDDYDPPLFVSDTLGHADGINAGFIRQSSALAIIVVSDEEDCSVTDPDLFNVSSARYGAVDLNLRCFTFPAALRPVARYVDGLLQLRRDPNLLTFAAIVGVPVEAVGMSYEGILAHPDMVEMVDPASPSRLRPSCNRTGNIAFPPRRIVGVAQGIEAAGARSTVQSICQDTLASTVDEIVRAIYAH